MEIWLIQFLVLHSCPLKTNKLFQQFEWILPLAFYKYFPEGGRVDADSPSDAPLLLKAKNRTIDIYVKDAQRTVMKKMSKTARDEYLLHKQRMWALTTARSPAERNKSIMGKLPPELMQLVQKRSWEDHYNRT